MLTAISKFLYCAMAIILATMIVYGKLFVFKKRKPQFVSDYAATIAGFLGVYVILSLILIAIYPSIYAKLIIFGFAITPFIIGILATYHTEKYYTVLQVILLLISAGFVL